MCGFAMRRVVREFVDVFGEELIDVCASVCKVPLHILKVGFVEVLAV